MSKRDRVYLLHMLESAQKVVEFTRGCTRQDLESNEMLALAIVRLIEIIGEAANALSPECRAQQPDIPWRSIIGTRHRLIHGYFEVDLDIIWTIVSRDIPELMPQLDELLQQCPD